jgi:hypothetical protein
MFDLIKDFTLNLLPAKKRTSQSGWTSFNAVCCHHNGHNSDSKGRGGIKTNINGGISYHCFNCKFKCSYVPGRALGFKYRRFLNWLGADANEINRLVVEALRLKDLVQPESIEQLDEPITFESRSLPAEAQSFLAIAEFQQLSDDHYQFPKEFVTAVDYVYKRKINMQKYEFYWTPEVEHKLSHRVIVPFFYQRKIVGYTARAFNDDIKPKYYSDHPSHFVFNLDNQAKENKFVLVVEGAFDAMAVDGVAVLSGDIAEQQADLIEDLGKEVIVVPDFDVHVNKQGKKVWPGRQLIDRAIEYGWSVSFPVWAEQVKDVSEAVGKYGKLFTLVSILDAVESNSIKIKILSNKL